MAGLHAAFAWVAAASVVVLLATAALTATGRLRSYRALDRAVLVQLGCSAVAALAGLATAVSLAPPRDALHVLYAAVGTLLPVGVRVAAQGRDPSTIGRWVTVAALVAVGATLRSFMTGS